MELNKIHNKHCLDGLKKLEKNSIDCCVTSPPYWRLRSYGEFPYIWEENRECSHTWETYERTGSPGGNNSIKLQKKGEINYQKFSNVKQAFCSKCGAWKGDLGLEPTPELYVKHLKLIFREVKRVLKPTGTLWINIGDTYARQGDKGVPNKSLCLIPSELCKEMLKDGWILRNEIVWHKPNAMPHSALDRFTSDYEKVLFFVKKENYYFKQIKERYVPILKTLDTYLQMEKNSKNSPETIEILQNIENILKTRETKRNKRCVWSINTEKLRDKHLAPYPQRIVETCIEAGCPEKGIILDPFMGSGTTARVAQKKRRDFIGFEINPEYIPMAEKRSKTVRELF